MKAVLGFLLLLGGITLGWLVLSGKFPPAASTTGTATENLGGVNQSTGGAGAASNPNLTTGHSGGPGYMPGTTGVYGT
jgi:hypothetical protein